MNIWSILSPFLFTFIHKVLVHVLGYMVHTNIQSQNTHFTQNTSEEALS